MELENVALRHQIGVLRRSAKKRPKLTPADRLVWVILSRIWGDWRSALAIVKPETVIAWHRKGFRLFWTWKVRRGKAGRPAVTREVRDLIRRLSRENPLWGAPHIHGELLKLGLEIGETSVGKYMLRRRKPPSQTWRTFLDNHVKDLVSVDLFTVPTIRFQILYVFLVLAHDRRRVIHFNVTAHPTAEWTGQQLREAFPFDQSPRYLLRDRDGIFGDDFRKQVHDMKIEEVLSASRSPWQRAYVERVYRLHSARVLGPCDRLRRRLILSNPVFLFFLLSPDAAASFVREGRTGASARSVAGAGVSTGATRGRRTTPSLRTMRCLKKAKPQEPPSDLFCATA